MPRSRTSTLHARPRLLAPATAAVLSAGLVLGACSSSNGPLVVGQDQNGRTVTVDSGHRVQVTLTGTDWQFTLTPAFGALSEVAVHLSSSHHTSTASAVFLARRKGTATVGAQRAKCGNGPCHAGQGSFTVHVTVNG